MPLWKKSGLCRPFLLCQKACSGDLNAARQLQHNTLNLFLFQVKYISLPKPCLEKGFHSLLEGTKQPQHKHQVHQFCFTAQYFVLISHTPLARASKRKPATLKRAKKRASICNFSMHVSMQVFISGPPHITLGFWVLRNNRCSLFMSMPSSSTNSHKVL